MSLGNPETETFVNNLLDQQPRIYNPSQQDGTDPATYDIVGRAYFAGVTVKY